MSGVLSVSPYELVGTGAKEFDSGLDASLDSHSFVQSVDRSVCLSVVVSVIWPTSTPCD